MQEYLNKVHCGDCLTLLKELPDNSVDLVLTDPPYGLGNRLSDGGGKLKNTPMAKLYRNGNWIDEKPSMKVFNEIFRISKNQVICGGNYFHLPPTRCVIAWDKKNYMPTLSNWEYIWTSFDKPAKIYRQSSMNLHRQHPTQKPVALGEWILNQYSKKDDIILDCFCGSGSFLVACERLGKQWIGCEISPEYVAIANERIKAEQAQLKLPL